uniref:Mannose-6-phosphate isomerase n=1 Tax=Aegilops tauschii TaxID=37682 RepID=M8CV90_AEGTA
MASSSTASSSAQLGLGLGLGLGAMGGLGLLLPADREHDPELAPELARALHALRPTTYRDANHKPEMAVAVTEFRALCGFVSVQKFCQKKSLKTEYEHAGKSLALHEELKDVLRTVPEVRMLVGKEDVVKLMTAKEHDGGIGVRSYLQSAFTKLMATSKEAVAEAISKLRSRLNGEIKIRTFTEKEQLVLSLEQQYPGDVGVLSAFFFNYVKLRPGEALYIGANEPHAYLSGECVECMATSDNVIRAGLTPKYKDVQTLCSMLTYKQMFPEILQGVLVQPYVIRYTPPFDEFEVDRYLLPQGESVTMLPVPGPSIFLVMTGEGEIQADGMPDEGVAKEGDVFFVPARTEMGNFKGHGCSKRDHPVFALRYQGALARGNRAAVRKNVHEKVCSHVNARGNRAAVRKNVHEKVCSNMNMSRVPLN